MFTERPAALPHVFAWHARMAPGATKRILPDGCLDVIWHDGRVFVAGPDTFAGVHALPGEFHALRFADGTGATTLGLPADELTDRTVPLDALWPAAEVRRIAESASPATALGDAARRRWQAPDPALVEVAARARAGWTVDAIAERLGLSARHLQRRVKTAFGYGPKTLTRILRMQRALRLARGGLPPAGVAAETGYSDQAHLSREVRALTGVPLRTLARSSNPDLAGSPGGPEQFGRRLDRGFPGPVAAGSVLAPTSVHRPSEALLR